MPSFNFVAELLASLPDRESLKVAVRHYAPTLKASDDASYYISNVVTSAPLDAEAVRVLMGTSKGRVDLTQFVVRNLDDLPLLVKIMSRERRVGVFTAAFTNRYLDIPSLVEISKRASSVDSMMNVGQSRHAVFTRLGAEASAAEILAACESLGRADSDANPMLEAFFSRKEFAPGELEKMFPRHADKAVMVLTRRKDFWSLPESVLALVRENIILDPRLGRSLGSHPELFDSPNALMLDALVKYDASALRANPRLTEPLARRIIKESVNARYMRPDRDLVFNDNVPNKIFSNFNAQSSGLVFGAFMNERLKGNLEAFETALVLLDSMASSSLEELASSSENI